MIQGSFKFLILKFLNGHMSSINSSIFLIKNSHARSTSSSKYNFSQLRLKSLVQKISSSKFKYELPVNSDLHLVLGTCLHVIKIAWWSLMFKCKVPVDYINLLLEKTKSIQVLTLEYLVGVVMNWLSPVLF